MSIQQYIATTSIDQIHRDLSIKLSRNFDRSMLQPLYSGSPLLPVTQKFKPDISLDLVKLDIYGIHQKGHCKSFYSFQQAWSLITHEFSNQSQIDQKYALVIACQITNCKKHSSTPKMEFSNKIIPQSLPAAAEERQYSHNNNSLKHIGSNLSYHRALLTLTTHKVDSLVLLFDSKSDRQKWLNEIIYLTGQYPYDTSQLFPFFPRKSSLCYHQSRKYSHTLFEDLKYVSALTLDLEVDKKDNMMNQSPQLSISKQFVCSSHRSKTNKSLPGRRQSISQYLLSSILSGVKKTARLQKSKPAMTPLNESTDDSGSEHCSNFQYDRTCQNQHPYGGSLPKLSKLVRFRSMESLISTHEQGGVHIVCKSGRVTSSHETP